MDKFRKTLMLVLAVLYAGAVYPASLEDLVPRDQILPLTSGESITRLQTKNISPTLAPSNAFVRDRVRTTQSRLQPSFMAETLRLYKKPGAASQEGWTQAERRAVYNAAIGISSLAGVQYYSPNTRKMRVLYDISSVIDGPDSKKRLDDPFFASPPTLTSFYALQKDEVFGDNVYRYTYHASDGAFFFSQENISPIKYGIITLASEQEMLTSVAVIDSGPYLLSYVVTMVKTSLPMPAMNSQASESFTARANGMLDWFFARASRALLSAY
jgi:hypothetical protein